MAKAVIDQYKQDALRWRYTQHPEYFVCGPFSRDGDYVGYSVGITKYKNGKPLGVNQCVEGRGDTLEEAIDNAMGEVWYG